MKKSAAEFPAAPTTRAAPATGLAAASVLLACMLGGKDRRTLFVITNSGSGPAIAAKKDGRIETMRVDVPGAGLP